jgi:autophagy-related protein 33
MAARGVSVLKFVGTVSLGVLTGLSYTLSSLTIPALLTLHSAGTASRVFDALTTSATRHLSSLTTLSSSAFALAYFLSPRPLRHPYLLYASTLVLASQLAASDFIAPYLLNLGPARSKPSPSVIAAANRYKQREREKRAAAAQARMEASYEVLGSGGSDAHSEGSNGEEVEAEERREEGSVNGEEVRADVEAFLKKQIVRSALAGLGFLLSVVGIWGDGVTPVYGQTVVVEL